MNKPQTFKLCIAALALALSTNSFGRRLDSDVSIGEIAAALATDSAKVARLARAEDYKYRDLARQAALLSQEAEDLNRDDPDLSQDLEQVRTAFYGLDREQRALNRRERLEYALRKALKSVQRRFHTLELAIEQQNKT